ncbi:7TM diverse intracellular signaling domain-containing protein [Neolewinella maritima]|nr:7TM diverse intracellular signaling domain-containing protein [Neolewinella maritima]
MQTGLGAQQRIELPVRADWTRTLIDELEVMSDEHQQWSAEALFAAPDDMFGPNTVRAKPTLHNYWARFVLVNTTDREQWVSFESYYWDYVTLHFRDSSGRIAVVPSGILASPYNNKFLTQPASEYEVLANFASNARFRREDNIHLIIRPTLPTLERKAFTNYLDGITFGIMFGLALYNLFLYVSIRDRTYLWYTLYIFSFAISFMTLFASEPPKWTQFFTPDYPLLAFYLKKISDPVIWIAYLGFVRSYLVTRERHPAWDKILQVCTALIALQFLLNLTGVYHFTGVARLLTWNTAVLTSFILGITSYVAGYNRAKFFVLGQLFLVAGITITSMHYAGLDVLAWLPETNLVNYFRTPSATFAFGAVEAVVFSLALADKYNTLQGEITRVQVEQEKERSEALRLQELDTFKTRFYANITHEFRTPLTVIEGMALELEREPEKETGKRLELIQKNSRNLLSLVNQLLDLSKLQAGKMGSDLRQADVIPFVRYLVELHESYATMHKLNLQFHSELPALLMDFDAKKLERILTNLLSNAIKFTPAYGRISVVAKKVNRDQHAQLRLIVKDSGIGIAEEQVPFIFDRFHQIDTGHGSHGTGIGLALVNDLVATMEGHIDVESELNKGSSFVIDLPIHTDMPLDAEMVPYDYATPHLPGANGLEHQNTDVIEDGLPILLIIEDNADVAYYLQSCLDEEYQILICRNGKLGVEKALALLPDIIISDVMMPEMDGFAVCRILKENERTSHIPIILLTAKASPEDKLTGLTHGADAYLIKPFEKEELMIRLHKLLEIRQTLQQKYSSTLISHQAVEATDNKEDTYVAKVEQIVLHHLEDEAFSIHDLARALHLSRSQMHRKLKALTGMSPAIYIRHVRLQQAKILLSVTDLSISEIAYRVGFKTPVYFSQVFKETFGESPSATRK